MQLLEGHTAAIRALAFSVDSCRMASGARDDTVLVWGLTGGLLDSLSEQFFGGLCFLPGGELVTAGMSVRLGGGGTPHAGSVVKSYGGMPAGAAGLAALDATVIGVGTGHPAKPAPGSLSLLNVQTGKFLTPAFTEPHGVRAVTAHPPSRTVAWTNGSRRATVWDIVRPDAVHFPLSHTSPAVAFHPDGTLLAVAQEWGVKLIDLGRRQERLAWKGHTGQVTAVAFTPDGRSLLTASWDGSVKLWDPSSGTLRQAFRWPLGRVTALAVAPDGTRVAAGGDKGAVVVWDAD